jgi:DNA replication protein DnaC
MSAPLSDQSALACPRCHGTGWEFVAGKGVRECDCRRGNRREQLLKDSRIPGRYLACTLDNYYPQGEADSEAYRSQLVAQKLAAGFVANYPNTDTGLLLMGPCGVGKTHLAVATLTALVRAKGIQCLFYDFRDLLKEIQETYAQSAEATESQIIASVVNAEVLVLDELGAAKPTDWARDTMTHIITRRYNESRVTIFTTNYLDAPLTRGEDTLTERIGVRLRSRLYEMCQAVMVKGDDYRRRRSELRCPKFG